MENYSFRAKYFDGKSSFGNEAEVEFLENNKGLFIADLGWLGAFADPKDLKHKFTYSLEQDSVLVIKTDDSKEQRLIVKKFSDTFDYIELINRKDNKSISMRKVIE